MSKSSKEYFKLNPDAHKGENHPLYGTHYSEDRKTRQSKSMKKYYELHPDFGCKENHWNWQGGTSPLDLEIRNSNKYRAWRFQIFYRDNFTCKRCNIKGVWLEAHHIKPFRIICKEHNIISVDEAYECLELWDLNNGITLCKECHNKITFCKKDKP